MFLTRLVSLVYQSIDESYIFDTNNPDVKIRVGQDDYFYRHVISAQTMTKTAVKRDTLTMIYDAQFECC